MSSFTTDHRDVTVRQPGQHDVTTHGPRDGRVSMENPRVSRSTNHALSALLPPGEGRHGQQFAGDDPCREPADVQLLRVSDRVSVDDAGRIRQWGIPQYNVVRRSTARTTRAVYVEFERTQCAGCRSDDAQNSRTIYHQLSRLLTSIVVS